MVNVVLTQPAKCSSLLPSQRNFFFTTHWGILLGSTTDPYAKKIRRQELLNKWPSVKPAMQFYRKAQGKLRKRGQGDCQIRDASCEMLLSECDRKTELKTIFTIWLPEQTLHNDSEMLQWRGKFHKASSLYKKPGVVNSCWERENSFSLETKPCISGPIISGQPWAYISNAKWTHTHICNNNN